jgi:hypothetical protein
VSLKAGTATAPPRVEEVRVRAECDCSTVVLTVGESLKAVERPDLLTITDSAKASAVLNLLVKSQGKEVFVRYWSPGWDEESVNTRGLADALTWVDRQQGRTDADRSGAVIDPDTPAIPASMVTDTDAFTDPERTSKELPAPVRKLFARDLRRGCRPHSTDPNRSYFDAHWVGRQRVVFFVECTRPDLGPTHRVYTATGQTYEDARVLELEQWDERVLRSGKAPRVRRAVPTSPMFEPAETLVLLHRRDDIKSCYIEHTYRWLEGGYRLLAVHASECPRVVGGVREGERTLRFRVPAEQQ